jgi:hypothetical protein
VNPPTVVLAVAFVVAPGAGLTFALFGPGAASLPTRLALMAPLGFATISGVALLLALAHALYLPVFLVLYMGVTVGALVIAFRRHAIREHVTVWRREVSDNRWPYMAFLLLVLLLVGLRVRYSPLLNFVTQTPLRYWADGLEIADAHSIPDLSLQWGHLFPPAVSKIALNSFNAAGSLVLGRGPLPPMGALLFVASSSLILAALGLGRELGLRLTAPLLVILLFSNKTLGNPELTADLSNYRAENWGRLLMLAAVLLAVRAFRSEGGDARRDGALAGILLGIAAGTHLVPFAIGVTFAASYGLGTMLVQRRFIPMLRRGAVVLGVSFLVGGFVLLVPGGDIGFEATAAADAYRDLRTELGLDSSWDPTVYLAKGRLKQKPQEPVNGFYKAPSVYFIQLGTEASGGRLGGRRLYLLPIGIAVALSILLVLGPAELKPLAIAAVLLALSILAATLYFAYRYDVYAIAQFGLRRLADYTTLPFLLLGLGVLEIALVEGGRWLSGRTGSRLPMAEIAAAALVVVVAAVVLPRSGPRDERLPRLATALEPLAWIEREVPCQGRILADRRTLGTFETFSRHSAVLEGMGPYLRPDVLTTAIREMFAAREFFLDPASGEEYLRERGVAVVVTTRQPIGGASKVASAKRLGEDPPPFLQEVVSSEAMTLYRVTSFDPAAVDLPDVTAQPGYRCGGV